MCLEREITTEEARERAPEWDGKTVWKVARYEQRAEGRGPLVFGLYSHTRSTHIKVGEWVAAGKMWIRFEDGAYSYPEGFHAFLRREDAEALADELSPHWKEVVLVRCEISDDPEDVVMGLQYDGTKMVPALASHRILPLAVVKQ